MATIKEGKGVKALAVLEHGGSLQPTEIGRPSPGPNDVHLKVLYCGMCHSDIHATNGDWGINLYPIAPGHEIAGIVIKSNSSKFKKGQRVGVGCMVESCRSCDLCDDGLEQHCPKMIQTYSSMFPVGHDHDDCSNCHTNGGYSQEIVVHERFVFEIPKKLDLKYVGPLLCAGITVYSPLNRYLKDKKNQSVAVVGFGGLGMMAVKIAKKMGAERVTIFSRGLSKAKEAIALGARLVSHQNEESLKSLTRSFDIIIDTVSAHHEVSGLINTLKVGGTLCFLGGVPAPYPISSFQLLFSRYTVSGSLIGGVPETQEMLNFCADHDILPDIKVIEASEASDAYHNLQSGKSGAFRHVIDMSTINNLFGGGTDGNSSRIPFL